MHGSVRFSPTQTKLASLSSSRTQNRKIEKRHTQIRRRLHSTFYCREQSVVINNKVSFIAMNNNNNNHSWRSPQSDEVSSFASSNNNNNEASSPPFARRFASSGLDDNNNNDDDEARRLSNQMQQLNLFREVNQAMEANPTAALLATMMLSPQQLAFGREVMELYVLDCQCFCFLIRLIDSFSLFFRLTLQTHMQASLAYSFQQ